VPFLADLILHSTAFLSGDAPVRKLLTHLSQLLERAA
jgi:hypothetical protein